MIYNETNYTELVKLIGSVKLDNYLDNNFRKKRYELQVHTQGYVLDSYVYNYPNEDPENTRFLLDNYEPITKGSIWRGIDNVAKIITNTAVEVQGDAGSIQYLSDTNFIDNYSKDFINKTTSNDPNTHISYVLRDKWEAYFFETAEIVYMDADRVIFVDLENSEFNLLDDYADYYKKDEFSHYKKFSKSKINKFKKAVKKDYKVRRLIYVSRDQYIEMEHNLIEAETKILRNLSIKVSEPYYNSGVDIQNGVGNSPIHPFIPFGNRAILQYRTFVAIENIYGYPRMTEVEVPCNTCNELGSVACDPCDIYPMGKRPCSDCGGNGAKSQQSVFNIYKRKVSSENPELNNNIPSVEFHTLPTDMMDRSEKSWLKSLELGEDAIYVQKKTQTGNTESAESKTITLEAMYSWLDRVSVYIYSTMNSVANEILSLNNKSSVEIEKPQSFAVLDEMESLKMFSEIIVSESPNFLKASQLEGLLKRYVSKTNVIHKIVSVLKRVDKFLFYSNKELQDLSDRGIVSDSDWRVHTLAYPALMQMIEEDRDIIYQDENTVKKIIESKLNIKKENPLDTVEESTNKLRETVGGLTGIIEIAKAVASGMYDLEAGISLISSLYGVTRDESAQWLGTPQIQNSEVLNKVEKVVV